MSWRQRLRGAHMSCLVPGWLRDGWLSASGGVQCYFPRMLCSLLHTIVKWVSCFISWTETDTKSEDPYAVRRLVNSFQSRRKLYLLIKGSGRGSSRTLPRPAMSSGLGRSSGERDDEPGGRQGRQSRKAAQGLQSAVPREALSL